MIALPAGVRVRSNAIAEAADDRHYTSTHAVPKAIPNPHTPDIAIAQSRTAPVSRNNIGDEAVLCTYLDVALLKHHETAAFATSGCRPT